MLTPVCPTTCFCLVFLWPWFVIFILQIADQPAKLLHIVHESIYTLTLSHLFCYTEWMNRCTGQNLPIGRIFPCICLSRKLLNETVVNDCPFMVSSPFTELIYCPGLYFFFYHNPKVSPMHLWVERYCARVVHDIGICATCLCSLFVPFNLRHAASILSRIVARPPWT